MPVPGVARVGRVTRCGLDDDDRLDGAGNRAAGLRTDEVTSVPMYAGSELTGDGELPGAVDQVPPQAGGVRLSVIREALERRRR